MSKDLLHVAALPGLEPEEQPVTREVDLSIALKGDKTSESLGRINSTAQITKPAHEVAAGLRRICANCKHFDQAKAREVFAEADKTQEGKTELQNLYANLIASDDLSKATLLRSVDDLYPLGFCHAFSKVGTDVIVHPLSHCPTESSHLGFSDQFTPIDRAAEKRGDLGYDEIMKRAAGKVIT
jgi:hypothetical protein